MPHSPRFYDNRFWLLNSGMGELWTIDPERGEHEVVCQLPGYLRGLSFVGHYALIGLSQMRQRHAEEGLPVEDKFKKLLCGAALVDLRTGKQEGTFEFAEGCEELYDVQFIPKFRCPSIVNEKQPAAVRAVTAPEFAYWIQPRPEHGQHEEQAKAAGGD